MDDGGARSNVESAFDVDGKNSYALVVSSGDDLGSKARKIL